MSEPATWLPAEDVLRGVVTQLVINGEQMTVIIPATVIAALGIFAEILRSPQTAESLPSLFVQAMPWAQSLPDTELRRFVSDLTEAADSGPHAPEQISRVMHGWRATAEAYGDPAVLEALRAPAGDYGPVPEPAE